MATDYLERIAQVHGTAVAVDDDQVVVVNVEEKTLDIPSGFNKQIGVVGDHNSNAITFKCPKIIESHNVTECQHCYIKWQSAKNTGTYTVDKASFKDVEGEESFELTWLVDKYVTQEPGNLKFQLCFKDTEAVEGDLSKVNVLFQWRTAICKNFSIGEGIVDEDTIFDSNESADLWINSEDLQKVLDSVFGN